MTKNNEARTSFTNFCKEWGYAACGQRNVFTVCGKKWAYVDDPSAKEIRQFYEDCGGAYQNGNFIDKSSLSLGSITRVSPSGLKAYNAKIL